MRKALKKLFLAGAVATSMFGLSSCGLNIEATANKNLVQTEVVLQKANYKVLGIVSAESEQTYIFGIGGLSKKSLAQSAMRDLYRRAELIGKPRAVINVNITYKNAFYTPIVVQTKAIATGTVIEFTD